MVVLQKFDQSNLPIFFRSRAETFQCHLFMDFKACFISNFSLILLRCSSITPSNMKGDCTKYDWDLLFGPSEILVRHHLLP